VYVNSRTHVTITCPNGHTFQQRADGHAEGKGCQLCANLELQIPYSEFIRRAKSVHGGTYDYSRCEEQYQGIKSKIDIECSKGHVFSQSGIHHVNGRGCPRCNTFVSKAETEILSYISKFVVAEGSYRTLPNVSEVDIFIPSHNIAIEYNGLYFHSENPNIWRTDSRTRHKDKTDACAKAGVRLVHIFEDDWIHRQDVVKAFLASLLGEKQVTHYARKTELREIEGKDAKAFLDQYHIQGGVGSTHKVGHFIADELLGVTLFTKRTDDTYELVRHACKRGHRIVGSLGKASKFMQRLKPVDIITFCDVSLFTGESYVANGYRKVGEIPPDYRYVVGRKREHKFGFRHIHLKKKLANYDPSLTEKENCTNHKIFRIYDCGKDKYMLAYTLNTSN